MQKHLWILSAVVCLALVGCGGDSASSIAGTYELDTAALADALVEAGLKEAPEESRGEEAFITMIKDGAAKQAAAMSMKTTLDADGTWVASGSMGGGAFSAKGTWKLEGNQLTLTTTEEDGKEPTDPETKTVTIEDGVIIIQPEGMPFQFRLVRK